MQLRQICFKFLSKKWNFLRSQSEKQQTESIPRVYFKMSCRDVELLLDSVKEIFLENQTLFLLIGVEKNHWENS